MAQSTNPILSQISSWTTGRAVGASVSTGGTVQKTGLLLLIVTAAAGWAWWNVGNETAMGASLEQMVLGACLVGFGLAVYTRFRPEHANITAPIYAVVEGILLGVISAIYNKAYRGLPVQAVGLTLGTFAVMLTAYRTGLIKVTDRLRAIVTGCMGGIMMFYLVAFVLGMFGFQIPFLYEGGIIGVGFSLFVTGLAAFRLLLNFDTIEQSAGQLPKQYEWVLAFGLVVTLIWLYLEFLSLLRKLQR
jgi:uncharacterized YccA/Bax inhibitor family protein